MEWYQICSSNENLNFCLHEIHTTNISLILISFVLGLLFFTITVHDESSSSFFSCCGVLNSSSSKRSYHSVFLGILNCPRISNSCLVEDILGLEFFLVVCVMMCVCYFFCLSEVRIIIRNQNFGEF